MPMDRLPNRFGLNILASLRDGEAAQPGAGRLAQIRKTCRSWARWIAFLPIPGIQGKLAGTIAAGTNVSVANS